MKPMAAHGIYFQHSVYPNGEQCHKDNRNQVIDSS